ncbi:OapA family protein [Litorilituus lipolyticus]|uniref:Peptidase M24 n=1 Tax=Litorilituus lipolyticus TaxID=2491017 RepID=A0A502L026_9GAMM|nr:peptidoglycan DD-metalloendopeptidase family protein [Litorilituus lipolyticus]TPH17330.1 peptidase M24 [Litorilituus lipolyticus]
MKNLTEIFLQLPKIHRIIISALLFIIVVILLSPTQNIEEEGENLTVGKRYQIALPQSADSKTINPIEMPSLTSSQASVPEGKVDIAPQSSDLPSIKQSYQWQTAKVKSGDSLARIFKRLGYSAQTTYAVSTAKGEDSKLLKKLDVGEELKIANDDNGQLVALEYPLSKTDTLFIDLVGDSYQSHKESKQIEVRETFSHGTISSSFWNAGVKAGLTDAQVINFANIFGWDIDFAQDIRNDDSFHVIYEQQYVDGEYIGTGNILAAEFVNQGEVFQAVRFTDGEYYTPDGKSMRKAFLRAPVNFKYISSSFKRKRFHPVQKRWKAHRGVDYAAKTGTPVVAAGNGKVTHATYNKYNGNYVFIQHGNGIVTKYLHFSKRAVKKGQRVKQGQVIGYVGATGLAAGPHLHYEFLLNGVHRNPRTVKLPDAKPIAKKYKAEFTTLARKRLLSLEGSKNALISMQESSMKEASSVLSD